MPRESWIMIGKQDDGGYRVVAIHKSVARRYIKDPHGSAIWLEGNGRVGAGSYDVLALVPVQHIELFIALVEDEKLRELLKRALKKIEEELRG